MTAVTYQQVQDAIERVELHNFQGTAVVVCALICVDGKVVLGVGQPEQMEGLNLANISARARKGAENELARQLQAQQDSLPPETPPEVAVEASPRKRKPRG